MSDDEIQFEDVAYREPHKARRPDQDPRLACIAYRTPGHDDMPIFLDKKPTDHIERHALRDTSVELGGILLGKECVDETTGSPFVWITEALEAKHYENTQASFTYTHDSWEEITRERDAKYPDLDIVGWYHTHPDFGIFLSSHDLFIHHNFFDQPLQVAYVVDPIRQDRGFFQWKDERMVQVGGFWLSSGRAERMSLARLVNDLEGIPTADGGGGGSGMSPRLEAELIAMLSRPQHLAVAADRGQSATLFALFGMLLGALVVYGFLFLQTIGKNVEDQTKAIAALSKAQTGVVAEAKSSLIGERISAKEAALDAILREVPLDPSGKASAAKVSQIIAERDEVKRALSGISVTNDALTDQAAKLKETARSAEERARIEQAKTKEANEDLTAKIAKITELNGEIEKKDRLVKDNVSGELQSKYNWAWYLAMSGWIGLVACGLGWASSLARGPVEDDSQRRSEPPQHTISIT